MGGTCNYFIALKIPELLVSVYRARARQGRKLEPLALASNVQQSRIGPELQLHQGPTSIETYKMHGGLLPGLFSPSSNKVVNCQCCQNTCLTCPASISCIAVKYPVATQQRTPTDNSAHDLMRIHVIKKDNRSHQHNSVAFQDCDSGWHIKASEFSCLLATPL